MTHIMILTIVCIKYKVNLIFPLRRDSLKTLLANVGILTPWKSEKHYKSGLFSPFVRHFLACHFCTSVHQQERTEHHFYFGPSSIGGCLASLKFTATVQLEISSKSCCQILNWICSCAVNENLCIL